MTHPSKLKTHCKRGHKFTVANTKPKPNGCRNCRMCAALWHRQRNMKRADAEAARLLQECRPAVRKAIAAMMPAVRV